MKTSFLTTVDNPYSPIDSWDQWYAYDEQKGYHTCELLARVVKTSDEFGVEAQAQDIEAAMDDIVDLYADGFYKKVSS